MEKCETYQCHDHESVVKSKIALSHASAIHSQSHDEDRKAT